MRREELPEAKSLIEEEGYKNVAVDNIEGTFTDKYTIYVTNDNVKGSAELIEKYFGIKATTEIPDNIPKNYDIVVVLGPSQSES